MKIANTQPGLDNAEAWPLAKLDQAIHVGTMKLDDKGCDGASYEGHGLSFSNCPQAWVSIARLGGKPWWQADVSRCRILDGHDCLEVCEIRDTVLSWAEEEGLVKLAQVFEMRWWDSEEEAEMYSLFDNEAAAWNEVEDREYKDAVCAVERWVSTEKLRERMRQGVKSDGQADSLCEQWALAAFAEDHGLDGVWWNDNFNPGSLSAPRGVLFPHTAAKLDWHDITHACPKSKIKVVRRGCH